MSEILIYIVFIFGFFGGLLVDYKIISPEVTLISEASVYLLFCCSLLKSKQNSNLYIHLGIVYLFFIIDAICSAILNNSLNMSIIIGLRLVLRFYIFYLALINLNLNDAQYKRINKFLFVMFILQLPVSTIRLCFQGIQENTIGTYAGHGGGLTPLIPIIAIGYLAGFYSVVKPRLIYVILGLWFIFYGIAGAKRAVLFMYPPAFIGLYYLALKAKRTSVYKIIAIFPLIIIAIIGAQVLTIKLMPSLNPENKVGGSINIDHIIKFAEAYESQKIRYGGGGSRIATTILTLDILSQSGIDKILFGFGPGSLTPSELDTSLRQRRIQHRSFTPVLHSYGHTGMTYILIEYGFFGLFIISAIFFVFFYRSWKWFQSETDPYWKALSIGTLVFTSLQIFVFFAYNFTPIADKTIVPVYFYAMSMIFHRLNKSSIE